MNYFKMMLLQKTYEKWDKRGEYYSGNKGRSFRGGTIGAWTGMVHGNQNSKFLSQCWLTIVKFIR